MEVAGAILTSREMSYADVSRAIAYFKRAKDIPTWEQYLKSSGTPAMPVVIAHNDICRDDLLFEVELDAIRGGTLA
jgi:hypothetical protein